MPRIERNPDAYTIGVPQIMFSPVPTTGNFSQWRDWLALAHAFFGVTNAQGYVLNTYGVPVGTPEEIVKDCYLGALDNVTMGGDVETLEHTVSNRGYEETDRVVVLSRPIEYSLTFDEPDVTNLSRYMIGQQTMFSAALRQVRVTGQTFQGSKTDYVTIADKRIGDPTLAIDAVKNLWITAKGSGLPPNGVYGFIVGGTNEVDCVGPWKNKRNWVAYADINFVTKTVGPWSYIAPKGTAVGDAYGGDQVVTVNDAIFSLPDSEPVVAACAATQEWNAEKLLAFNGFEWVGADTDFYNFSVLASRMAYKKTFGCAFILTLTEIGTSLIHVVPRCSLVPDGTMSFSADSWLQGTFKMNILRDGGATFKDRDPALPIPFGYMQTLSMVAGL